MLQFYVEPTSVEVPNYFDKYSLALQVRNCYN